MGVSSTLQCLKWIGRSEYLVMISNTKQEETPTRWKRPVRILLMVNQWSSSERNSAWCYPLADALFLRIALLMNSLCLVSACAGLDYEWTKKSSRAETRFMHYSVLIIFHAPVRMVFMCAFTRTWNCGGRLIVIQIIAILQFTCLFFFFFHIKYSLKPHLSHQFTYLY